MGRGGHVASASRAGRGSRRVAPRRALVPSPGLLGSSSAYEVPLARCAVPCIRVRSCYQAKTTIRERLTTLSNSLCDGGCARAEVGWQMVACGPERGCRLELLRSLRRAPSLDFARRRANRAAGPRLARMRGVLLGVVLGARIRAPKFPPKSPARRAPKIFPKICAKKFTISFN